MKIQYHLMVSMYSNAGATCECRSQGMVRSACQSVRFIWFIFFPQGNL